MYKIFKIKNLLWLLIFLGITKFFLIIFLISSNAYRLEAKEENIFAGCPPEFSEILALERAKLYKKAKKNRIKRKRTKNFRKTHPRTNGGSKRS